MGMTKLELVAVQALLVCLLVSSTSATQVPAIYVFGDSLVDVGNNQYLPGNDNSKVELPYGVDFPNSRSTGRFSNGYNVADFGNAITLRKQIKYFAATKSKISANLEAKTLDGLLSKSLFLISSGANDLHTILGQNKTAAQVSSFYADVLSNYTTHIMALYNLGARRFGIIDIGPLGCTPAARLSSPTGACIDSANALVRGFNDVFTLAMAALPLRLQGIKYSIGSFYNILSYFLANPHEVGFKDVQNACCGGGRLHAQTGCLPNSTYCADRREYLFWDRFHGTQAAASKCVAAIYAGPLKYAAPINFDQLVQDSAH